MGFWERAVGAATPPAPARDQAPLDAWWAPRPLAPPAPAAPVPQQSEEPPPAPRQAQSASLVDRCPACTSGDYFKPTPETKPRCYTCGYPVLHTTSGMVSTDRTAATPSRQVNKEGGYRPQQIIGRIK